MTVLLRAYWRSDQDPHGELLREPTDVRQLIDALLQMPGDRHEASVTLADDPAERGIGGTELRVGVNAAEGVGGLRWSGGDGTHFSVGRPSPADTISIPYYLCGLHETEYEPDSEVPVSALREALEEFLDTGRRPTCVQWQPHPLAALMGG